MIKKTLLALCLLLPATSVRAELLDTDPPEQKQEEAPASVVAVESLFQDLLNYVKNTPKPDVDEVNRRADTIKTDVDKVVADASVKDEFKQRAYIYALAGYLTASQLDSKTNVAKFTALADEVRKTFPGSPVASAGDAMILQWDMPGLDTAGFLARITDYAKLYPKSNYGPALGNAYVQALREVDLAAAKTLVADLLKLYPAHPVLVETSEGLNLIGKDAALAGPTLDGAAFDIADWKGKVVVIDFWATWCGPCKKMTPDLIKLYDKFNAKGLEIVGVSLDNKKEDVETYVAAHKTAWTQVYFPTAKERQKIAEQFAIVGIPTLFVVGKDGKFATFGVHNLAAVEAAVEAELAK